MLGARLARSPRRRGRRAALRRPLAWLLSLATLAAASVGRGEQELARADVRTLTLELGGGLLLGGTVLALSTPSQCSWCDPPAFDEALAFPVAAKDRRTAAAMSHVFSFVALPTVMTSALLIPPLTTAEDDAHAGENLALAAEVVLVDLALNLAFKRLVARQRPAYYYRRMTDSEYDVHPNEANASFFSGDTSAAFALASSAATVSFLRGYESAPYVTAVGAALATGTGLLRIGADVHWPSDVITGALVGTALGIGMPLLLHPRREARAEPGGRARTPLTPGEPASPVLRFSAEF